ncbi:LuxR C-terminal-related transcriptional regulator [Microvirga sp. TS319]|uniref:LuxR C-terminal-related transcriptional regulator n=1 Tax=Microvirga sp. TS319 TaxID=3241165 RepID=UPI003519E601
MLPLIHNRSFDTEFPSSDLTLTIPTTLICDNLLLCSGLQTILQGTPFALIEAVFPAVSGRLHRTESEPALVVIEHKQNTSRLVEVVRHVKEQFPQARIVVMADQFDSSMVRLGHGAGVNGFCLADSAREVLIKSFELVMLGENILPSAVLHTLMDAPPQEQEHPLHDNNVAELTLPDVQTCKLSARETEILECLTKGEPNKVIARKLEISEATIKVHVKAILRKIGVANRTQAAMWACQRLPSTGEVARHV